MKKKNLLKSGAVTLFAIIVAAGTVFGGCATVEPNNITFTPSGNLQVTDRFPQGETAGSFNYYDSNGYSGRFQLEHGEGGTDNHLFTIKNDTMLTAASPLEARAYRVRVSMIRIKGGTRISDGITRMFTFSVTQTAPQMTDAPTQEAPVREIPVQISVPNTAVSTEADFEITQNANGGITITGYNGTAPNVVIPESIEGIPITEIGQSAFVDKGLISVVIPDSVTFISGWAFMDNQLTSVVIPKNVETIWAGAFENNKLREVIISESVTSIGSDAFRNNQLENVVIPNGVTTIEIRTFENNRLTGVTLGSGVRTIMPGAFASNQISSLVIPAGVRVIGRIQGTPNTTVWTGAFQNNALTSIVIPAGVTYVGTDTFANNQITNVTVTSNTTVFYKEGMYHEGAAFANNPLASITLPANCEYDNVLMFPHNLFDYYESQNRKAGTYTWSGRLWSVK